MFACNGVGRRGTRSGLHHQRCGWPSLFNRSSRRPTTRKSYPARLGFDYGRIRSPSHCSPPATSAQQLARGVSFVFRCQMLRRQLWAISVCLQKQSYSESERKAAIIYTERLAGTLCSQTMNASCLSRLLSSSGATCLPHWISDQLLRL